VVDVDHYHDIMNGGNVSITYDLIKSLLNNGRPIHIVIEGHSSVAIGWSEDLSGAFDSPQIIIYNTWDKGFSFIEVDEMVYDTDRWYIISMMDIDFGFDTSEPILYDMPGFEIMAFLVSIAVLLVYTKWRNI